MVKWLRDRLDARARARAEEAFARRIEALAAAPGRTLREEIEEWAAEGRDRPALVGADEILTCRGLYERANRWSRWAIVQGIGRGEPVALILAPRPERTAAWIGLGAIGAVATFFDPALPPEVLARAVDAVRARRLVVDGPLLPVFEAAAAHVGHACTVWVHGPHGMAYQRLDEALDELSAVRLTGRDRRSVLHGDPVLASIGLGPDGRIRVAHVDHGTALAIALEVSAHLGIERTDRVAVAEAALSLEGLLAPTLALGRAATADIVADRPVPPTADVLLADEGALARIDGDAAAPRLTVVADATRAGREPDPDAAEGPRTWAIGRDGDRPTLRVDGRWLPLPRPGPPPS